MNAPTRWILMLAATLPTASIAEEHPLIDSKFMFMAGEFFARESLKLRVDGTVGIPGVGFDVNESLKSDYNDRAFSLEGRWRFGERWFLATQYFDISDSESIDLEDDIIWGDLEFRAGIRASAATGIGITRLYFGRDLIRTNTRAFGVGGGLHRIEISASVSGEAFVEGASVGESRGFVRASGPLPNLGLWYTWAPNEKWAVATRLDWLSVSVDPYDGTIVNGSVGVNYRAGRYWGLGVNYNLIYLDAAVDDAGWFGEVEMRYHGPYAHVSVYW